MDDTHYLNETYGNEWWRLDEPHREERPWFVRLAARVRWWLITRR